MKKNKIIFLVIQSLVIIGNIWAMEKGGDIPAEPTPLYTISLASYYDTPWKFEDSRYNDIKLIDLVGKSGLSEIKKALIEKKRSDRSSGFGQFLDNVNVCFYLNPRTENVTSTIQGTPKKYSEPLYILKVEPNLVNDTDSFLEKLNNYSLSIPVIRPPKIAPAIIKEKPVPAASTPPNQPSSWYSNPYLKYIAATSAGLMTLVFAAYKFDYLPSNFDFIQNKISQFFSNALPHNTKQ